MRQQSPKRLESSVDALHTTSLVAVGDLSPYSLLLLHVAARRDTADVVADTAAVAQRDVLASNPASSPDVALGLRWLLLLRLLLLSISDFGDRHIRGHRAVLDSLDAPVGKNKSGIINVDRIINIYFVRLITVAFPIFSRARVHTRANDKRRLHPAIASRAIDTSIELLHLDCQG